jgi:hypothetical protein
MQLPRTVDPDLEGNRLPGEDILLRCQPEKQQDCQGNAYPR